MSATVDVLGVLAQAAHYVNSEEIPLRAASKRVAEVLEAASEYTAMQARPPGSIPPAEVAARIRLLAAIANCGVQP